MTSLSTHLIHISPDSLYFVVAEYINRGMNMGLTFVMGSKIKLLKIFEAMFVQLVYKL